MTASNFFPKKPCWRRHSNPLALSCVKCISIWCIATTSCPAHVGPFKWPTLLGRASPTRNTVKTFPEPVCSTPWKSSCVRQLDWSALTMETDLVYWSVFGGSRRRASSSISRWQNGWVLRNKTWPKRLNAIIFKSIRRDESSSLLKIPPLNFIRWQAFTDWYDTVGQVKRNDFQEILIRCIASLQQ